jgi:hypothetical protein
MPVSSPSPVPRGSSRRWLEASASTTCTTPLLACSSSKGESPTYVKEQMGHSSIQVTVDIGPPDPWSQPAGGRTAGRCDRTQPRRDREEEGATA